MAPSQTNMQAQGRVKYKGIHEPKGRVKGFRVEIRPSGSSTKIWVGTFDSRNKAMRAFDAAVYFTGKEPYYFLYPENYFPPRVSNWLKEDVQRQAKEYAERTDILQDNEASFLGGHAKVSSVEASKKLAPSAEVAKEELMKEELMKEELKQLDEILQNAEYLDVPKELPLESDFDWMSYWRSGQLVEDSKVDLEEGIVAAYLKGFSAPQLWTPTLLPDIGLLEPEPFPHIDFGGFSFGFKSAVPQDVDSKQKREASEEARDHKCVCYSADTIDVADIFTSEGSFTDLDIPLPHDGSLKRKRDASEGAFDPKRVVAYDRKRVVFSALPLDGVSADAATTDAGDDWIANVLNTHPSLLCE